MALALQAHAIALPSCRCMQIHPHATFSRSRLSEVSMSLWIQLCNHTYIHTYIHASADVMMGHAYGA